MSPIQAVVSGRVGDFWGAEEREEEENDPEADEEELMTKELEMALEEDGEEFLSSSLPVASSDVDVPPDTSYDEYSDDQLGSEGTEVQPHWSVGLPPSSPPPASSPSLTPQSDLEDVEELDLLSGLDNEGEGIPRVGDADFSSNASQYSDDLSMCLDELSTIFSDPAMADLGIGMGEDPIIQNGVMDFDFTQFWESVKPLVGGGDEGGDAGGGDGEIDHGKLAEDVQALFNGCLV